MFCRKCGANIPDDAYFCPKCGVKTTVEPKEAEPEKKPSRLPLIIGVAAVVLAAVLIIVFVVLPKNGANQDPSPEVVLESEQATAEAVYESEAADEELPEEDSTAKEGKTTFVMPDLSGKKLMDAKKDLENLGVAYVTEYESDPSVAAGYVIRQSADAGSTVSTSDKVTLFVAIGENGDVLADENPTEAAKEASAKKSDSKKSEKKEKAKLLPMDQGWSVTASYSADQLDYIDSGRGKYGADHVIDGNMYTSWDVHRNGNEGVGEYLDFASTAGDQTISGIRIIGGKVKEDSRESKQKYYANRRPKQMTVQFSSGEKEVIELEDDRMGEWQEFRFDKSYETDSVRLTINSIYSDRKTDVGEYVDYEDCVIAEVEFQ